MGKVIYLRLTGTIFGVICCLHLLRLIFQWQVVIAGWIVPLWLSWFGLAATGALCLWAYRTAAGK
jgi:hypothetical protein